LSKTNDFTNGIIQKEANYILGTYPRPPFVLSQANGLTLVDTDGNNYLDFGSGIAVNALGHSDPEITSVVQEQISQLSHISNLYHSTPQVQLAEQLCNFSFADKVFFSNSGSESVEAALKFARKNARVKHGPGKMGTVAFQGGFHGRTYGSLSVTSREDYQAPFRPLVPDIAFGPYNNIEAAQKLIGPNTCAVIVEPVQGEGGIHVASIEFMKALREQCDKFGALLIVDEIQSGMGRTGKLWAYQHFGIEPDIMTLAKALGGGLPIGATLLTDAVAQTIAAGDHGSTFGGGPVVSRVALVVLKRVSDPSMLNHVATISDYLLEKLTALNSSHIKQIRGLGLMIGVELDIEAKPLLIEGYKQGILLLNAGSNVLRLLPPLIITEEEVDKFIQIMRMILDEDEK
jgi:predicted acetylornithine/succinylornithine family transaminase